MNQIGGWMDRGGGMLGDGICRMSRALGWNGVGWREGYCTTAFGLLAQGKRASESHPIYRPSASGNLILVADGTVDGEAILKAYQTRGAFSFARMLQGSFALALLDETKGELILSRSRDGDTPLYYREESYRLIFSSQIKGILAFSDGDGAVNKKALRRYLRMPSDEADLLSLYDEIYEFPRGETGIFNRLGQGMITRSGREVPMEKHQRTQGMFPISQEELRRQLYGNLMQYDAPFFEPPIGRRKERRQLEAYLWELLAECDPEELCDLCEEPYEHSIKRLSATERLRFMAMLYQAQLLCRGGA